MRDSLTRSQTGVENGTLFLLLCFYYEDGLLEFSLLVDGVQEGRPDCEVQSLALEANPVRPSPTSSFVLKINK